MYKTMLNLKTGKHFADAPTMTRGGFLKGILASGIAPSITLGAVGLAGSANASVGRGMMRCVGARNAEMFGETLPYDAEANYLISHGTEWIDTGIKLTNNDAIECIASISSRQGVLMRFMGCRSSSYSPWLCFPCFNWCADFSHSGITSYGAYRATTGLDSPFFTLLRMISSNSERKLEIVGGAVVAQNQTLSVESFVTTENCLLFRANDSGSSFIGSMWSAKIYGQHNMDFHPVVKDGVGYMHDRISNGMFGDESGRGFDWA